MPPSLRVISFSYLKARVHPPDDDMTRDVLVIQNGAASSAGLRFHLLLSVSKR